MSLTFQLARGVLALALFGALALTAWLSPAADSGPRVIFMSEAGAVATTCPIPPPALRLALSPADLPASPRGTGSCRA
jgi:hypothetical protein